MSDDLALGLRAKLQTIESKRALVREQLRDERMRWRRVFLALERLEYEEKRLDELYETTLAQYAATAPYEAATEYPVNDSPVCDHAQLVKEQKREDQRRQRRLRRDRDMREAKKVYREELEAAGLDGVLLGLKPPKGRPTPEYLAEREKYGEVLLRCVNAGVKITQLAEITAWSKSAISELVGSAKAKAEKRTGLAA